MPKATGSDKLKKTVTGVQLYLEKAILICPRTEKTLTKQLKQCLQNAKGGAKTVTFGGEESVGSESVEWLRRQRSQLESEQDVMHRIQSEIMDAKNELVDKTQILLKQKDDLEKFKESATKERNEVDAIRDQLLEIAKDLDKEKKVLARERAELETMRISLVRQHKRERLSMEMARSRASQAQSNGSVRRFHSAPVTPIQSTNPSRASSRTPSERGSVSGRVRFRHDTVGASSHTYSSTTTSSTTPGEESPRSAPSKLNDLLEKALEARRRFLQTKHQMLAPIGELDPIVTRTSTTFSDPAVDIGRMGSNEADTAAAAAADLEQKEALINLTKDFGNQIQTIMQEKDPDAALKGFKEKMDSALGQLETSKQTAMRERERLEHLREYIALERRLQSRDRQNDSMIPEDLYAAFDKLIGKNSIRRKQIHRKSVNMEMFKPSDGFAESKEQESSMPNFPMGRVDLSMERDPNAVFEQLYAQQQKLADKETKLREAMQRLTNLKTAERPISPSQMPEIAIDDELENLGEYEALKKEIFGDVMSPKKFMPGKNKMV